MTGTRFFFYDAYLDQLNNIMTSENTIKYKINPLFGIICLFAKNKTIIALAALIWGDDVDKHENVMYFVTSVNVESRN